MEEYKVNVNFENVVKHYGGHPRTHENMKRWVYCNLFHIRKRNSVFYRNTIIRFEPNETEFILINTPDFNKKLRTVSPVKLDTYVQNTFGTDSFKDLETLCTLDEQDKYFISSQILEDIDLRITDAWIGTQLAPSES